MSVEKILEQAKLYGYTETMRGTDRKWFGLHHQTLPIHLDLYPETEEFALTTNERGIKITTEICGSFTNEVHFLRWQRQLIEVIEKLR